MCTMVFINIHVDELDCGKREGGAVLQYIRKGFGDVLRERERGRKRWKSTTEEARSTDRIVVVF